MRGSIRFFVGFLVVFASVGLIENPSTVVLLAGVASSLVGLGLMSSGAAVLSRGR